MKANGKKIYNTYVFGKIIWHTETTQGGQSRVRWREKINELWPHMTFTKVKISFIQPNYKELISTQWIHILWKSLYQAMIKHEFVYVYVCEHVYVLMGNWILFQWVNARTVIDHDPSFLHVDILTLTNPL